MMEAKFPRQKQRKQYVVRDCAESQLEGLIDEGLKDNYEPWSVSYKSSSSRFTVVFRSRVLVES